MLGCELEAPPQSPRPEPTHLLRTGPSGQLFLLQERPSRDGTRTSHFVLCGCVCAHASVVRYHPKRGYLKVV